MSEEKDDDPIEYNHLIELNAFKALEKVGQLVETGKLDPKSAQMTLEIVFGSFNQIITDPSFLEISTEMSKELDEHLQPIITHSYKLNRNDKKASISILSEKVIINVDGKIKKYTLSTHDEANLLALKTIEKLQHAGFKLLE